MADKKERTVKDIGQDYGKTKADLTNLREGKYYTQNEEGKMVGSIAETLNVAKSELFKKFAVANEGLAAKSVEELDDETKAKYDKFVAENNEVDEVYKETDEKVKKINEDRNKMLHEASEKLDKLEQEMKNKLEEVNDELTKKDEEIKEKQAKLNSLKDSDYKTPEEFESAKKEISDEISKLNNEKSKLESDKARLEEMLGEINRDTSNLTKEEKEQMRAEGKEVPPPGMKQRLRESLASQKLVRENAKNGAIALFGKDRVKDDFGMTQKEKEEKEKEEKNAQQQLNNQQVDPKTAAALQQAMKNAGIQPGATPVVEGEAEKAIPTAMQYLATLGYAGGILNVKSSMGLLDEFTKADEKVQLEILKDAEAQSKIFEAMKVANSAKSPITAFKFGKTRRNLVKMANSTMMRKALQDLDKDVDFNKLDEVESKFKSALREYDDIRIKKEAQINALPEGEEKAQLQAELDEINKKYSALTGVKQFRDIANLEMIKPTDKFFNFIDSLRSGENVPKLPSKADYEAEKKRDEISNRAKILTEQNKVEDSFNNKDNVVDQKDLENKDVDTLNNQEIKNNQTINEQEKNKDDMQI